MGDPRLWLLNCDFKYIFTRASQAVDLRSCSDIPGLKKTHVSLLNSYGEVELNF